MGAQNNTADAVPDTHWHDLIMFLDLRTLQEHCEHCSEHCTKIKQVKHTITVGLCVENEHCQATPNEQQNNVNSEHQNITFRVHQNNLTARTLRPPPLLELASVVMQRLTGRWARGFGWCVVAVRGAVRRSWNWHQSHLTCQAGDMRGKFETKKSPAFAGLRGL